MKQAEKNKKTQGKKFFFSEDAEVKKETAKQPAKQEKHEDMKLRNLLIILIVGIGIAAGIYVTVTGYGAHQRPDFASFRGNMSFSGQMPSGTPPADFQGMISNRTQWEPRNSGAFGFLPQSAMPLLYIVAGMAAAVTAVIVIFKFKGRNKK